MPIYRQIAEQLRQRISANEFSKSQKLPSNRELAERYQVNHLTVRQALKLLEHDGVIDIAHGRGAFVMQQSAKRLRTALVLPSLGHEQSGIISQAVRRELGKDAMLHVFDYPLHPSEEATSLERILNEGYNSAIIFPSMTGESVRSILRMIVDGFPLVLIDQYFGNVPAAYVLSDNQKGGFLATDHLIKQGCKNIACFMSALPSAMDRYAGYRDALAMHGLRFDPNLVVELPAVGGDIEEKATTALLARADKIDGIFYFNDYQALIGMKQLKFAGVKIPQDIKVIGFDDLALSRFSEPTLSSIRQNHELVGKEAAHLLMELVRIPASDRLALRKREVPVELVVRDSA